MIGQGTVSSRYFPTLQSAHQDDATPRAMPLVASDQIGGTRRKAKAAVHTRIQRRIARVGLDLHLLGAFQCHVQALSRVEGSPETAHDFPNAFAIGAEMSQSPADRPGGALERHWDLPGRGRSPQSAKSIQDCVTGPANHAVARSSGDQALVKIVREKIERIIHSISQHSEPKRDRSGQTAPSGGAPERCRSVGGESNPTQIAE